MRVILLITIIIHSFYCFPQQDETQTDYTRKGLHLGFHIAPGIGNVQSNNSEVGFGFNSGADLTIYFNNHVGINSGISYLLLPIKNLNEETVSGYGSDHYHLNFNYEGFVASVGVPLKFILTTGRKKGFYFKSGINVLFPLRAPVHSNSYNLDNTREYSTNTILLSGETDFGLSINISKITNFNIGISSSYSFTNFLVGNFDNKGLLVGLQLGLLFKLKND